MSQLTAQLVEEYKQETKLYGLVVSAIEDTKLFKTIDDIRILAREIVRRLTDE